MLADRACVGKEPIHRYDSRDPREDGEKCEERHAAGRGQDPICGDRPEHPPEDISPPTRRNLLGRVSFAPAARLTRTREIDRAIRILARPNLSAPIMSLVHFRVGGTLVLHWQRPPESHFDSLVAWLQPSGAQPYRPAGQEFAATGWRRRRALIHLRQFDPEEQRRSQTARICRADRISCCGMR